MDERFSRIHQARFAQLREFFHNQYATIGEVGTAVTEWSLTWPVKVDPDIRKSAVAKTVEDIATFWDKVFGVEVIVVFSTPLEVQVLAYNADSINEQYTKLKNSITIADSDE